MVRTSTKLVFISCFLLSYLSSILVNADTSKKYYKAWIEIDYESIEKNISPLLYGNNSLFLFDGQASPEYFGKDNGIWSKRYNDINRNARDLLINSGITILRYPVGGAGEYYYWGWSVLPFNKRRSTVVPTIWDRPEHYIFGTPEFIKLCKALKAEAIINVNFAMRKLEAFYDPAKYNDSRSEREIAIQQAANWVEFMNIPAPTGKDPAYPKEYKPEYSLQKMPKGYFAYLRASIGFSEPFIVKYWEIGNELEKFYTLDEYIESAIEFGKAMKAVDPSIKIGWIEFFGEDFIKELKLAAKFSEIVDFLISHDYVIPEGIGEFRLPLWSAKPIKRQVTIRKGGEYVINLSAFARIYFGKKYPQEVAIPPRLKLKVDDTFLTEIVVDKNLKKDKSDLTFHWRNYKIPVNLSPGNHTLSLQLTNFFVDRSFPDTNRRSRMVFLNSWTVEGKGERYEIVFPPKKEEPKLPVPYRYYSLINGFSESIAFKQSSILKYAPHLFIAQTESGYSFANHSLWGALGDAAMIMEDMKYGIKIRNLHFLFGPCYRNASIHSGRNRQEDKKENYHVDPEYFINKMFSQHFGDKMLSCNIKFSKEQLEENNYIFNDLQKIAKYLSFPLRVTASRRGEDMLYIALINFHTTKYATVEVNIQNFQTGRGTQYTLRAKDPYDFNATNENDKNNVFIQTTPIENYVNNFILLPNSFTIIELKRK
jgi:alpha-L-arabinofuranosidase